MLTSPCLQARRAVTAVAVTPHHHAMLHTGDYPSHCQMPFVCPMTLSGPYGAAQVPRKLCRSCQFGTPMELSRKQA